MIINPVLSGSAGLGGTIGGNMGICEGSDLLNCALDLDKPIETVMKPWGCYKVYKRGSLPGEEYWVKTLHFYKGQSLSLQSHEFRSEEWRIAKGRGVFQLNNSYQVVQEGWKGVIKPGDKHRIWNDNCEELVVIEIAFGSQLSEDDLVRWEDQYNRG